MAQTISWIPPENSSVGSVIIYRADTTKLDSLGSRTIIDTIGAKDGSGNWVLEYSDTAGTEDSIYRVQFYDGVGSSPLSDAIGREYSDQLATFNEVIRLGGLQNMGLGSDEIYYAIEDASQDVFDQFGDPMKRTMFFIDSETGITGQAYDFTGDTTSVYQVRQVIVDTTEPDIVRSTDYDVNYGNGVIKFTDDFLGSYQGKYVMMHWVPQIVNVLVKNMAAKNLLDGELVLTGADSSNPKVQKLQDNIDKAVEAYRPKGVFSHKTFDSYRGYTVIPQELKRTHLYFSY